MLLFNNSDSTCDSTKLYRYLINSKFLTHVITCYCFYNVINNNSHNIFLEESQNGFFYNIWLFWYKKKIMPLCSLAYTYYLTAYVSCFVLIQYNHLIQFKKRTILAINYNYTQLFVGLIVITYTLAHALPIHTFVTILLLGSIILELVSKIQTWLDCWGFYIKYLQPILKNICEIVHS